MIAVRQHIIVGIDKIAQATLQEKSGTLYIPPKFKFMLYNLQYGTILSIGPDAAKYFPDMQEGDMAIFHHCIESNDSYLLGDWEGKNDAGNTVHEEYRSVPVEEKDIDNMVYAIMKPTGQIIAHPDWIFLSPNIAPARKAIISDTMENVEPSMYHDEKYLIRQMDLLKMEIEAQEMSLNSSKDIGKRWKIRDHTNELRRRRQEMSSFINSEKMVRATVLFANEGVCTKHDFKQGSEVVVTHADGLIPLSIDGQIYCLAMEQFTVGVLEQNIYLR